jgi:hypothetical protein
MTGEILPFLEAAIALLERSGDRSAQEFRDSTTKCGAIQKQEHGYLQDVW